MNKREQQRIIKEEKQRAARQREKINATVRKTVFFVRKTAFGILPFFANTGLGDLRWAIR